MSDNKWSRPSAPPPPMFVGEPERNFQRQIVNEITECIVGQTVAYYAMDLENTNFHPLYGEAIHKTFKPPVRVYALVEWQQGSEQVSVNEEGIDKRSQITIHFHKKRLTEDQDIFVREGDFVAYGSGYYELVKTFEPRELFGQTQHKVEISAIAKKVRKGLFNVKDHSND